MPVPAPTQQKMRPQGPGLMVTQIVITVGIHGLALRHESGSEIFSVKRRADKMALSPILDGGAGNQNHSPALDSEAAVPTT
jgi:hypothetical protein